MPGDNKTYLYDESRIYEENGEVKVRHIIHDSPITDMTPHPTECRVFIKDGEVMWVDSKEIQKAGGMDIAILDVMLDEIIDKNYLLP